MVTLLFIYLAFPVLIVPSSLPAIKSIIIGETQVQEYTPDTDQIKEPLSAEAEIYQLNIPTTPSLSDKLNVLKNLHRQGWQMIFPKD